MLKAVAHSRPRNTADCIPGALSRTDRVRHSGYAVIITNLDNPTGEFAPAAARSALGRNAGEVARCAPNFFLPNASKGYCR